MRIFQSNAWRAPCALLLAALLLLVAGCAGQSDENALRDSFLQGIANGAKPSVPPETGNSGSKGDATPPEAGPADLASSPWAQKLVGSWVAIDPLAEPEFLHIIYIAEDGRIYVSDNAYYAELGYDAMSSDSWTLVNGEPKYIDIESGEIGRIEIDAGGTLVVKWEDGSKWMFGRPDTPRATTLLMGSEYFYLAENAKLAYLLLGEELSEDERYATVWLNDAVWVDFEDEALIAEYGLEDYFADENEEYFIYTDDSAWRPLLVSRRNAIFCLIRYDDDGEVLWKVLDFAAFLQLVEERSGGDYGEPLLVYYSDEDTNSSIFAIREVYLA